ncbi:MAG: LysM peptidoglycan-binding domain-containing protein [Candidatus Sericytochromatia bacterium]|nr:LysM peptidoglycan-binding domain-containing protein [Candidatus Tanganyikabacteria bacterium]
MRAPDHQDDELFWAFRLLDTVVDRQHLDASTLADALREHDLWPGSAPRRKTRLRPEAVAVLAATVAWPASAWAEEHHAGGGHKDTAHQDAAHADAASHEASVTLSISDASSSQPLSGVRVLGSGGKVLGTTGHDGRLILPVGNLADGEVVLEGTGYRSLTKKRLNRAKAGTTVFIGLVPDAAHDAHAAKTGAHGSADHDAHGKPEAKSAHADAHAAGTDAHPATAIKVHFPSPTPAPRKVAKRPRPAHGEVIEQKAVAHGAQAPHGAAADHHEGPATHKAAPAHHDAPAAHKAAPDHHDAPAAHKAAPAHHDAPAADKAAPAHHHAPAANKAAPDHHDAPAAHAEEAAHHDAPTQSAGEAKGTVTVKAGDTLWGLAAEHLGSGERWRTIWTANRDVLANPGRLRIGQVLSLETHAGGGHATGTGRIRVRRGDSLWTLARKHLGSGKRWRTLYRLNRDTIGRPELIYPGQKLRLPGDPA